MTVYTNPQLVNLNLKLRTLPLPTEADLARAVEPLCVCLTYIGDNGDCPVHGPAPKPAASTVAEV